MQEESFGDDRFNRLIDPWERRAPIRLVGLLERRGMAPFPLAVLALLIAFVFFQVVVSPAAVIVLLLAQGVPPGEILSALGENFETYGTSFLLANTVGQILGLALPAYLLARLHTRRPGSFLRWRPADPGLMGLAFVGLVALTPVVQWLGGINETIPLPEWLREFEASGLELIERVLMSDRSLWFNLLVLAVTPAFCEELLFRGYVQRQAERGIGWVGGILFSGLAFGVYHLRLSQVLPLSVLGLYLAYLVWRTGSLWPAVLVHFANNAFAVLMGAYAARRPDLHLESVDAIDVPWYLMAPGALLFAGIIAVLHRRAETLLAQNSADGYVHHM